MCELMITPLFDVEQDHDFIYVNIRAPYIKASMIQFEVSDELFVFSLPPYYLRLRLPGNVIEDERMTSSYDLKTSTVKCKVAKLHPGEHFADLDMLSKLLATKTQTKASKIGIQEVDGKKPVDESEMIQSEDFDWEIEQEVPDSSPSVTQKYGFNNQYSEMVGISTYNGNDINELAEPEKEDEKQKITLLRATTSDTFDLEHYWADTFDDEMIKELLRFQIYKSDSDTLEFNAQLKDRVMKLGTKEFFLDHPKQIYIGIVPLVFAWAYDYRINMGESIVESSWNIGKIAPSMCFLYNSYTTVEPMIIDCTARALAKPLYRNWELVMQVWRDTVAILRRGKKEILTVFANLLQLFESDLHQVYRSILLEDYTIWIQYASANVLESLANEVEKSIKGLTKSKIYLPLEKDPEEELADSDDEDEE